MAGLVNSGTIEDCTLETFFRKQTSVMLDGVFSGSRAAVRRKKNNEIQPTSPAPIINLSSIAAFAGLFPVVAYSAAKVVVRSMNQIGGFAFARNKNYPIRWQQPPSRRP